MKQCIVCRLNKEISCINDDICNVCLNTRTVKDIVKEIIKTEQRKLKGQIKELNKKIRSIDGQITKIRKSKPPYKQLEKKTNKVIQAIDDAIRELGRSLFKIDLVLKRMRKVLFTTKAEKQRQYRKEQYKYNPSYRLRKCLRARIYDALKGRNKSAKSIELLGCSPEFAVQYLANLFQPGMSWSNHGDWHIDHIIPCNSFDLSDPDQQRQCFHYTNMQPLWAEDNLRKGDTI